MRGRIHKKCTGLNMDSRELEGCMKACYIHVGTVDGFYVTNNRAFKPRQSVLRFHDVGCLGFDRVFLSKFGSQDRNYFARYW